MFMQDITRFAALTADAADRADRTAAATAYGLVSGTLVETAAGWQPVESLRIGDGVHSLDGGLVRIVALNRRDVLPGEPVIRIAGGHFDACSDLLLLPGQEVLLDTAGLTEAPYASVTAQVLTACPGATRASMPRRTEIVTPLFAEEEAVWAQSGVLLRCPGVRSSGESAWPRIRSRAAAILLENRMRRLA